MSVIDISQDMRLRAIAVGAKVSCVAEHDKDEESDLLIMALHMIEKLASATAAELGIHSPHQLAQFVAQIEQKEKEFS
ncbi:hypothetical protein [Enterovibrio norvegicus]|uniref:hypothetical protein n=1 Tax=Enterovibrio norvegicus TaxID=188144 RepID=UPI00354C1AE7